jgi:hypothetical protein
VKWLRLAWFAALFVAACSDPAPDPQQVCAEQEEKQRGCWDARSESQCLACAGSDAEDTRVLESCPVQYACSE